MTKISKGKRAELLAIADLNVKLQAMMRFLQNDRKVSYFVLRDPQSAPRGVEFPATAREYKVAL